MTEPLVFLPGMMCDARIFDHQLLNLSRERAVMIAPTGQGERVEQIASDLLDQLPQRFALAGHSLGGIVAMELTRRAGARITRLCLMSTDALAEPPGTAAEREPLIVNARTGKLEEALRQMISPDLLAPGPGRTEAIEWLVAMGLDQGSDQFVRQCRTLQRRTDQQGTLRKIKVPTLILCGDQDPLTPVKRHSFMAELTPQGTLQVIENAGHMLPIEAPETVTEALRQWLEPN